MATTVFDLQAIISADASGYYKELNDAKTAASGLGGALSNAAKIGLAAIGAATTATAGFAAASVEAGRDFDKSMSQVAATMGKSVGEIQDLRDFAQEMGRTTAFSATQAADALNYMALAGYDADTSMKMLPNVLNLAAAGSMELARASDMVTDTQTAFGISLERTSQMVDEMAKAASTGNTSVEQLGDAFLTVGGLAQELNGGLVTLADGTETEVDGIQELEIALTAMANAGIKGSEAGTHMRNMLLKLSSPTSDGTKQLEKLGVQVFDTEGNMRSLRNVMGDLSGALSELTQEQKIQAISDLFNTRDLASAEALLNAVGEDWDKIGESILDANGAAQQMADTQLNNLEGDITLFKSALEGAQIAISDKLTPSLRDFVQFGTRGISELTEAFQSDGLSGAMDKFAHLLTEGLATVIEKSPEAAKVGVKFLATLIKGVVQNKAKLASAAREIISVLTTTLGDEFPSVKHIFDDIQGVIDGIFEFVSSHGPLIESILKGVLNGFLAFKVVGGILTVIATGIAAVNTAMAIMNGTILINPFAAIAVSVGVLIGLVTTLTELEKSENEEYVRQMTAASEAAKERASAASEYLNQLKGIYDNNNKITESVDAQYKSELDLKNELMGIVDENGKIKQGYEDRAKVIMEQLNTAFGTEMQMQDGVIQNYDLEMQKIDQIIEKKKAEAILDANRDAYAQALKEQSDLFDGMSVALDEYNGAQSEYKKAVQDADLAQRNLNDAYEKGSPKVGVYGQQLQDAADRMTLAEQKMNNLKPIVDDTSKAFYANQDFIKDYDALLEATETGSENLGTAITNMNNGLIESAPHEMLLKQANDAIATLDGLLKAREEGVMVTDEQIAAAMEKAQLAVEALHESGQDGQEGYAKGITEDDDVVNAGKKMVNDLLKAVETAQDSHSPSKELESRGKDAVDGYKKGIDDNFPKVLESLAEWLTIVKTHFTDLADEAIEWGTDMMANFIIGVESQIPNLTGIVAKAAGVVSSNLGFSEPETGPLSNFHTYAPDMMKLFAEGIEDNAYLVDDAINRSFDVSDAIISSDIGYQNNTSGSLQQMIGLLQELVDKGMDVSLEGDAKEVFHVVEKENRKRTKATGYNSLAMAGG